MVDYQMKYNKDGSITEACRKRLHSLREHMSASERKALGKVYMVDPNDGEILSSTVYHFNCTRNEAIYFTNYFFALGYSLRRKRAYAGTE